MSPDIAAAALWQERRPLKSLASTEVPPWSVYRLSELTHHPLSKRRRTRPWETREQSLHTAKLLRIPAMVGRPSGGYPVAIPELSAARTLRS